MKFYNTCYAITIGLLLTSCGAYFNQPTAPTDARVGEATRQTYTLRDFPEPKTPIVVGVYNFKDQTGQYKAVENGSTFSTAVPQGATTMLIKALEDSRWFTPIERENLSNLLNERNIIRSTRQEFTNQGQAQPALTPLLFAGVLLEGGIISYDSNIITGGFGARYFGTGSSTQYRQDRITIYLRAVSTSNGKILKTVYVSKTILSQAIDASVFKYVKYQRLLEVETGITKNEPVQLAVQNAIENAVEDLIIEGIKDKLWSSAKGPRMDEYLVDEYFKEKQKEESTLLYDRDQQPEVYKNAIAVTTDAPILNGDYNKKSLGIGGSLQFKNYISPKVDVSVKASYLYFTGATNFYKQYGALNVNLGYTFIPYDKLTPYAYAGLGGVFDMSSQENDLTKSTSGLNLQYGLGLKYNVNSKVNLFINAENNHTTTDGLDNIENGVRDDFYYNFSLGLEYRFGQPIIKNKIKRNDLY